MRYPRLHFRGTYPGTLDLSTPVSEWDRDRFEATWREAHVRVEWLRSPRGRLDAALRYCDAESANRGRSGRSPA